MKPATAVIGGIVSGVDMTRPIPDAQVQDLNHALANHNVLFFRDQPELTPEQQIAARGIWRSSHSSGGSTGFNPEIFVIHTHKDSKINNGGG